MSGLHIAVEGADGTGKSTLIEYLKRNLSNTYRFVREPVNYEGSPDPGATPLEWAYWFALKRAELQPVVQEWLAAGDTVISDRSLISSLVYQRSVTDSVLRINEGLIRPTHVLYLTASPEARSQRTATRRTVTEWQVEFDRLQTTAEIYDTVVAERLHMFHDLQRIDTSDKLPENVADWALSVLTKWRLNR